MDMFEKLKQTALGDDYNNATTENGANVYRTTGKSLLDLHFSTSSLRQCDNEQIIDKFMIAYAENPNLAIKWLFYARDIREGLGERKLFTAVIEYLAFVDTKVIQNLLIHIPEYGRYDDYLSLLDSPLRDEILVILKEQLNKDLANFMDDKPISLLAKWLPSINTSSQTTKKYAKIICKELKFFEKDYRVILSKLRKHIDVVEIKMSANEWDKIKYENVPSKANLIYKDAFLKHDEERRLEYLNQKDVKINSKALFPYEIITKYKYRTEIDQTLELLWNNLPNTVKDNGRTLVVADGSYSMTTSVGCNTTALDVANSLAIYFAERCEGQFKNKYITFSDSPQFVDFTNCKTLFEKIRLAKNYDEIANTNIEKVFKLILDTAIKYNTPQEELPQNILIVSDMEFDYAVDGIVDQKLFKVIAQKYADNGYKLPKLVFWNVNSRTLGIPMIQNELGVALVSGFSVNVFNMVLSNKTDPYEVLVETLEGERYKPISVNIS